MSPVWVTTSSSSGKGLLALSCLMEYFIDGNGCRVSQELPRQLKAAQGTLGTISNIILLEEYKKAPNNQLRIT